MIRILKIILILGVFLPLLLSNALYADSNPDSLFKELNRKFKKEYLSIGFLLQTVADFQGERSFPGNNGFTIANMRLVISGELDQKFGYLLRTNFVNSLSVLDAKLQYKFSPKFILDGGQFKSPFSKEFLTPAESIDFVNRSRAVAIMAPGRQIGIQARGTPVNNLPVHYAAGIFNGNGTVTNSNDDNQFLYVFRGIFRSSGKSNSYNNSVETGINFAYSQDTFTRISEELNPFIFEPLFFDGDRFLAGADLRFVIKKMMFASEYIYGDYKGIFTALVTDSAFSDIKAAGFHLTAGYMVAKKTQLLARWDNFDTNRRKRSNWLVAGLNYWPTLATELQLNYVVNTDKGDFKYHQILLNAQIAY